MNPARLAVLLAGMVLIILAGAVAYYQTGLRNQIPEGAAVAVLLLIAGAFVMALSSEIRRPRIIETVDARQPQRIEIREESAETDNADIEIRRSARPSRRRGRIAIRRPDDDESIEIRR